MFRDHPHLGRTQVKKIKFKIIEEDPIHKIEMIRRKIRNMAELLLNNLNNQLTLTDKISLNQLIKMI
jgi:hypothetical protein